jgi:hypothetical protein
MSSLRASKKLLLTHHAREKMAYYRLSEQRVRRVLNSPRRIEEGVAPKTIAAMAPASLQAARAGMHRGFLFRKSPPQKPESSKPTFAKASMEKETWSQEIWVMVQDVPTGRKIISAWRYPGVTKPRSELTKEILRGEYQDYAGGKRGLLA